MRRILFAVLLVLSWQVYCDAWANRLTDADDIDQTLQTDGQALVWDSTLQLWVPEDIAFDATAEDTLTWGDNSLASFVWTFDVSGTNVTMTFGSAALDLAGAFSATGAITSEAGGLIVGSGVDQNETIFTVDRASTDVVMGWDEVNDEIDVNYPLNIAGTGSTITFSNGAEIDGSVADVLTIGTIALIDLATDTTVTGTLTADEIVVGEDEYIKWNVTATPDETIHWDSITHDFHFSDDGYFEDIHPSLYILCTDNMRAVGWHYHYGEAYPLAFNTGIHNGTEIVLDNGVPLIGSNNDITEIWFPRGIDGRDGYVQINDDLKMNETAYFDLEFDNGNSSTTDTIDWGVGNKQKSTLTDDCTFTFTNPAGPCSLILKLIQDNTGSRLVTWPASVHWPAATAPTLTTTGDQVDLVTFYFDGSIYWGNSSLNYSP